MSTDDLTLHQIRLFRTVARTGSFTSAARHMNLSQSTLSRAVLQLERTLGVALFERDTRNVVLTAEGQQFLELADDLLANLASNLERFDRYANARLGVLSVSTLASFAASLLPKLLGELFNENQDLDLHVVDGGNDEVVGHLVSGSVELAIAADPRPSEQFSVLPILEEDFVAVVPDGHPWAGRDSVAWAEFDGELYVAARHGTSIRAITDGALAAAGSTVRHRFNVANIATLGGLVRSGFGVSSIPAMEFEGYRLDDLIRIPISGPGPRRTIAIVTDRERALSPIARRFLEIVPAQLARLKLPDGMRAPTPPQLH